MSSPIDRLKNGTVKPVTYSKGVEPAQNPLDRVKDTHARQVLMAMVNSKDANQEVANVPAVATPAVATPANSILNQMRRNTPHVPDTLKAQFMLPVTPAQLANLGNSVAKRVGTTTDNITKKFTTANFGALGDMLENVKTQANNLNGDDFTKKGIIGWVRRKTTNVKSVLVKRLQTADAAFGELEGKMIDQQTLLETWEADLELLYDENYQNWQEQRGLLQRAQAAHEQNDQALANFPIISADDPEAFMKAQLLEDARAQQNDISILCDTYLRQITMCEHNGPDLKARIRQSANQRKAIDRVIIEVIPMVKREFAKFLQTLEMQKSITLVDSAREMGDQALRMSANSSKDAAIASAKSVNTPVVSSDTINHVRSRAIEALQAVQQIEAEAEQERKNFAICNKANQAKYLAELQHYKAV